MFPTLYKEDLFELRISIVLILLPIGRFRDNISNAASNVGWQITFETPYRLDAFNSERLEIPAPTWICEVVAFSTTWAAVKITLGAMIDPPPNSPLLIWIRTCQGASDIFALEPPIIRC